ncbi:aspartate/glutamate racemase family protein [Gulosibacter sp. 10]|uniref:aspartate/glutamate racemase family protein n=1 Tax=Gulosibacter sp. 10 TaxID=1255570 RepID=UPI0020CBF702|nr:aspartate/glutamate racemase family protein [Gulosibacter sp. 10]
MDEPQQRDASTRPRTVLLVNPNMNRRTTALMTGLAQVELPSAVRVAGVTAERGPAMIVDPAALARAEGAVLDVARKAVEAHRPDAVIVAAIGDPGRAALQRALDVPVIGIGQASIRAAAAGGRRFGMATTTHELVGAYGCRERFTGVSLSRRGPLELASDPEAQYLELLEAVRASRARGAEAVIIAGGPLSDTARRLRDAVDLPIVEPVPAACALLRETGIV